jgi:isopenicillin N synthase-like dioxygenase
MDPLFFQMQHIPQADLNEFLSDDPVRKAAFVQQIGEAFQEIGFLALKGHFLDTVLQEQLYQEFRTPFRSQIVL